MSEELISTSLTLPADLKERLETIAKAKDMSVSQLVRRILREHFENSDIADAKSKAENAMKLPVAA